MKISLLGAELFHADGRTDGDTDKDDDAYNGRYNNLKKENRQRLGVATDAPSSGAVLDQSAGIPIAIM